MGVSADNIFILDNGDVLELGEGGADVGDPVGAVPVFVDGLGIGDIGQVVLRDRHHLANDGFLVAIVVLDESGELVDVELVSRGFVYAPEAEGLLEEARQAVEDALSERAHRVTEGVEDMVRDTLAALVGSRTRRRPMILPVVMRV